MTVPRAVGKNQDSPELLAIHYTGNGTLITLITERDVLSKQKKNVMDLLINDFT